MIYVFTEAVTSFLQFFKFFVTEIFFRSCLGAVREEITAATTLLDVDISITAILQELSLLLGEQISDHAMGFSNLLEYWSYLKLIGKSVRATVKSS